MTRTLLL